MLESSSPRKTWASTPSMSSRSNSSSKPASSMMADLTCAKISSITRKVKDDIFAQVRSAIIDEAGLDELLDRDDMLGVDAQVFLGDELSSIRNFSLSFTDEDADYTIKGNAMGSRV